MELAELFQARRSVRAFNDQPAGGDKIRRILELTNMAPSAGNLQAFEIFHVTAARARAALARAADQLYLAEAPDVLVFFANPGRSARKYGSRGKELYAIQDATIAATYAMLAATDLGLSTVWVGAFDPAKVTAAVGAPPDWVPVAVLPIGHASEAPGPTSRRPLDDLVRTI